jgi:hypothetical protein
MAASVKQVSNRSVLLDSSLIRQEQIMGEVQSILQALGLGVVIAGFIWMLEVRRKNKIEEQNQMIDFILELNCKKVNAMLKGMTE